MSEQIAYMEAEKRKAYERGDYEAYRYWQDEIMNVRKGLPVGWVH